MRWVRRLLRAATWGMVGLGVAALTAAVLVPRTMGWVPLTVLSGSMEPAYPVGSQVVVEPLRGDDQTRDLEVGDVITFVLELDSSVPVTHRVVDKRWRQDGVPVFTTRGDANGADDDLELTGREIRGRVVYHVPYLGYVAHGLTPGQRDVVRIALALGLLGYAGWQLTARPGPGRRAPARHRGADRRRRWGPTAHPAGWATRVET